MLDSIFGPLGHLGPIASIAPVGLVLLLLVGFMVPSAKARTVLLQATVAGAAVAWVAWAAWKAEEPKRAAMSVKTLMPSESRSAGMFAPVDAEMYGLRLPDPYRARNIPTPYLLKRPDRFVRAIKRVIRIATLNGSAAAATRLVGALEDFFTRADNEMTLSSKNNPLSHMTFGTLRDVRAVALAALQEIGFTVPEVRSRAVREAEKAVVSETTRTMRLLRDHLIALAGDKDVAFSQSIAVASREAGCDSVPVPFDDFSDVAMRTVHR